MRSLLYNQSCFNKNKVVLLTLLKSLSNIYSEAKHPVFILWLHLPGLLPSPAAVRIPQLESPLHRACGFGREERALSTKLGHVGLSLDSDIN